MHTFDVNKKRCKFNPPSLAKLPFKKPKAIEILEPFIEPSVIIHESRCSSRRSGDKEN